MERKERFNRAFEHLRANGVLKNQKSLAEALGATPPHISSALKGDEKYLTDNLLMRFCAKFTEFSLEWLMYETGDMLNKTTAAEMIMSRPKTIDLGQASTNIVGTTGVPYYNVDFQLGFDPMMIDNRSHADGMFDITPYNNCTCWCNARGDSMHPTIESGDYLALKRIEDFSYLINNEIYAIITKNDLRTIKRIKDNGETITLIPDNKEYDEQVIPKDIITHIFIVKGVLRPF